MSNTNTEVLTTAYEKLQGALTQSNTVLPKLEEAVEKGNLDNYATTSSLEDITNEYAKKTEVNSLTSSKAEKTDLDATNINVSKNTTDIATQSARIDAFTSLTEGSTTGDAELADIRVGANGVNYATAGTAVREQIKAVSDIYKIGKNLYDIKGCTDGYYVSETDGTIKSGSSYTVSSFIVIKENTDYIISYTNTKSEVGLRWALYDSSQNFITGGIENFSVPATANAKYIRFSYISTRETVQLEEGTIATTYENYGKTLIIPVTLDDTLTQSNVPADAKIVGDKFTALGNNVTINALRTEATFWDDIAPSLDTWTPTNATYNTDRWKLVNGWLTTNISVESGKYYYIEIQKSNVVDVADRRRIFTISVNGESVYIFGNSDYNFVYAIVYKSTTTGTVTVKVGSDDWEGEITGIVVKPLRARPTLPFEINDIETRMAGNNIAVGNGHLYLLTGICNTAIGLSAQKNIDTGSNNTALGYGTQINLKGGSFNNAIGINAQGQMTYGMYNTGIGSSSQAKMTLGSWNVAIGNESQRDVTTGNNNVSIGRRVHNSMTTGNGNVAIGSRAGFYPQATTTSNNQTLVGFQACQSGSENADNATAIGSLSKATENATALGANTQATGKGSVAIGVDKDGNGAIATNDNEVVLGTSSHSIVLAGHTINFNADGTVTWS